MKFVAALLKAVGYILFISLVSFSIIRLIPGDPVQHIVGERGASEERLAEIKKNLGLDQPIPVQFFQFSINAVKGNFGESIVSKQTVMSEFKVLWPATVELALVALLWSAIVGLALGTLAAVKRNSIWDYGAVSLSTVGFAMPIFWWGLLAIFFFSVKMQLFPVSGRADVMFDIPYVTGFYFIDSILSGQFDAFFSALKHVALPAFVLGTIPLALIVRVTRASIIDVAEEDYVRTARAKGLPYSKILFKHIFKNALPQILTSVGLALGQLLTGAILTETLFSWPGIGRWIVKSIEARDYPVVQAGVFYSMLIIILINWLTDQSVKFVSPRLRDQQK